MKYGLLLGLVLLVLGCQLVDYSSPIDPARLVAAQNLVNQVDESQIRSYLQNFTSPRFFRTDQLALAICKQAIVAAFKAMGYADSAITLDPVTLPVISLRDASSGEWVNWTGPFTMDNIIITKTGSQPGLRPLVVAAHYDTVEFAPGANDNGSGCAAVLEIARLLQNQSLPRTVQFVFFAFEETGLAGSEQFVAKMTPDQLPIAAYILETIGFTSPQELPIPFLPMPAIGNFLAVISAPQAPGSMVDFQKITGQLGLTLPVLGIACDANASSNPITSNLLRSDHWPFWMRGVPALFITDTANFRGGNHYHSWSDQSHFIDFSFLTKVVKSTLANVYIKACS